LDAVELLPKDQLAVMAETLVALLLVSVLAADLSKRWFKGRQLF
jgi:hypothetical protein